MNNYQKIDMVSIELAVAGKTHRVNFKGKEQLEITKDGRG